MRPIRYAGELPEDVEQEDDDERAPLVIEGIAKVIDLPVLRPEVERVCQIVGSGIGIVAVLLVAGVIWACRAVAWVVRRVQARASNGPKEVC